MSPCPLSIQLYTLRKPLAENPRAAIRRIADLGFTAVEPVCSTGMTAESQAMLAPITLDSSELKHILDDNGLTVSSAHTALPEPHNANEVLDEQEFLGNDRLIVPALNIVPGSATDALDNEETCKRTAERFNQAASLAAGHGMRVGYHNHYWEWNATISGRPGYDVFWDHLDPSIVAEVDIYWAQVAGRDPARVIAGLGPRAELIHVKDGPVAHGAPMTPAGVGRVDIAAALTSSHAIRWHIIEFDRCASDIFEAVAASASWLVTRGLSTARKRRHHPEVP